MLGSMIMCNGRQWILFKWRRLLRETKKLAIKILPLYGCGTLDNYHLTPKYSMVFSFFHKENLEPYYM